MVRRMSTGPSRAAANPYAAVRLPADPKRRAVTAGADSASSRLSELAAGLIQSEGLDERTVSVQELAEMIAAMNGLPNAQGSAPAGQRLVLPTAKDVQTFRAMAPKDGFAAHREAPAPHWRPFTDTSLVIDDALNRAPPERWGLTPELKTRIKAFTYLNENEDYHPRYAYIDNIRDGRGYTGGVIGFNLQSGSMLEIVQQYTRKRPGNELEKYLPRLVELNQKTIHDVTGMDGFVEAWKRAGDDPLMQQTQDQAVDQTFNPAMLVAEKLGVKSAFGKLAIYDAMVQHGLGDDDPDGLVAIIRNTQQRMRGDPSTGVDEKKWLATFLDERRKILACAHDPETRQTWAPSVERVDFQKRIFESGNLELRGPIDARPFFDDTSIP